MTGQGPDRRLAAILAADVVGYSQAMFADEPGTLACLERFLGDILQPLVAAYDGRVVKAMGNDILAEFPSAVGAALAADAIRRQLAGSDIGFDLRIGLHLGEVIGRDKDLLGDGVKIAMRLRQETEPGAILASAAFAEQATGREGLAFAPGGERHLESVVAPVEVYGLGPAGAASRPARRWLRLAATLVALAGLGLASLTYWVRHQ